MIMIVFDSNDYYFFTNGCMKRYKNAVVHTIQASKVRLKALDAMVKRGVAQVVHCRTSNHWREIETWKAIQP